MSEKCFQKNNNYKSLNDKIIAELKRLLTYDYPYLATPHRS